VLGIAQAERALSLDQNLAPCYAAIGWGKVMLGRAEETEADIVQALRLSPRDSFVSVWCIWPARRSSRSGAITKPLPGYIGRSSLITLIRCPI
jgi:hypothetical protein